jgi:predicted PurR-regulated permease PerM
MSMGTPETEPDYGDDGVDVAAGTEPRRGAMPLNWLPRVGIWAWSFVGLVLATTIVVSALAAVNEIVLPLTFAAVLAVIFRPSVRGLEDHGFKPSLAAGLVVLGLLALIVGVLVATVRGVVDQAGEIGDSVDAAVDQAVATLSIDQASLNTARATVEEGAPLLGAGFLTDLVSGIDTLFGLASGVVLGSLIMYYLLKDGSRLRSSVVEQFDPARQQAIDDFIGSTGRSLRDYGRGRSIMSAIVAAVIGLASLILGLPLVFTIVIANFIGGYIPYIGAFIGGGLAVTVALGEDGLGTAAIMLVVVVAANLLLENFVEPKVMGRSLDVHPLVVLVATALGGLLGGIVGLVLAVPFYVIARDGLSRLRSGGFFTTVASRAEPTVRAMLR